MENDEKNGETAKKEFLFSAKTCRKTVPLENEHFSLPAGTNINGYIIIYISKQIWRQVYVSACNEGSR